MIYPRFAKIKYALSVTFVKFEVVLKGKLLRLKWLGTLPDSWSPQREPQVGSGLFGVHPLILCFKFQFFKSVNSSTFHFLEFGYPLRKNMFFPKGQKPPKNLHKTAKHWLMFYAERFSVAWNLNETAFRCTPASLIPDDAYTTVQLESQRRWGLLKTEMLQINKRNKEFSSVLRSTASIL